MIVKKRERFNSNESEGKKAKAVQRSNGHITEDSMAADTLPRSFSSELAEVSLSGILVHHRGPPRQLKEYSDTFFSNKFNICDEKLLHFA